MSSKKSSFNLEEFKNLRKSFIEGIFSNNDLLGIFAIKGGSAIDIVHDIGMGRSSIDIDLSMKGDLTLSIDILKETLRESIHAETSKIGLAPIAIKIIPKPKHPINPRQSGYEVTFKLIPLEAYIAKKEYSEQDIDENALFSTDSKMQGPDGKSKFKIDISKFDYWPDNMDYKQVGEVYVQAYPVHQIVCEKIRTACEQLTRDGDRRKSRARDIYDIYAIFESKPDEMSCWNSNVLHEDLEKCFSANNLSLSLLTRFSEIRPLYARTFDQVRATLNETARSNLQEFDFYFNYVASKVQELDSFWDE